MQVRFGNYGVVDTVVLDSKNQTQALCEKLRIPKESLLLLDENGLILHDSNLKSCGRVYALHSNLKEESDIAKFYEESNYAVPIQVDDMTIPTQILGQEIKERFVFLPHHSNSIVKDIEQGFFGDYRLQINSYKKFKGNAQRCFEILKECEVQAKSAELLIKSVQKTFEYAKEFRNGYTTKLKEVHGGNCKILEQFESAFDKLKKIDLHPALQNEKIRTIFDSYHSEIQMRAWCEACTRSEESLFSKLDTLEQNLNLFAAGDYLSSNKIAEHNLEAITESTRLIVHIENFLSEKEPLIISILSNLADDLRSLHSRLKIGELSEEEIKIFKDKEKSHKELLLLMKEHQKELEGLLKAFVKTKLSNAKYIGRLLTETEPLRIQLRSSFSTELEHQMRGKQFKQKKYYNYINSQQKIYFL